MKGAEIQYSANYRWEFGGKNEKSYFTTMNILIAEHTCNNEIKCDYLNFQI